MVTGKTQGQHAYEAYAARQAAQGMDMPAWEKLDPEIRAAFEEAARHAATGQHERTDAWGQRTEYRQGG